MRAIFILFLLFCTLYSSPGQWQLMTTAPNTSYSYIVNSSGTLYAAANGMGVYKSIDSGLTWQQVNNGLNTVQSREVSQFLSIGTELFAATVDGIYKSTNGGLNWTKKSNGIMIGGGSLYEFTTSIFENNGVLFTGAYTGIYRSTDDAESWNVTNISGSEVMANYFVNHNGILFAARESINQPYGYKSTDNGLLWDSFINNGFPVITYFSEGINLWAGTIEGVWITTNNGQNWSLRNNGLSPDPYSSSIIRVNGTLMTSLKFGGSGIFKSTNDGMNWINISDGLPFLNSIDFLMIYGNKILAATSEGIYKRNISEIVTSISKQFNQIPKYFQLFQNYPNPFNPTTIIKFDISEMQFTQLKIYDVNGKEAGVLVNEILSPGSYKVNWDGAGFSSGVYFYKIQTGSFTQTKRMALLK